MTLFATTVATPLGQMSLLGTADCLHVAAFGDDIDELRDRLPASLRGERVERRETTAASALRDYFGGDVHALDRVDVRQQGGPFHTAVWREMRTIAPGTTVSYSELAARAGAPRAVRAAGSACARNAVCLFVPCHRVVRSDGGLGGYYYGLATKQSLLEHERCH
ncbi:MAG TPA: methylated-DNA--[protein]-cysteine S-methyltransferase [Candidatus Dormibacteraeota bacterium]|jgi:methylated-DNA-[protein]-cysteine S-methyltransferase|nr:methylated-DNA--[protein]-cysteine S-methyltransferase [Candidatus Dormibacteraeota bacterium]